jgi:hypothetical protein
MDEPTLPRSRNFRLIDLIVVVGIFTVIACLLIAALRKVEYAAATTHCQNNLKQIVLGIHDYASTYRNSLPPLSGAPRQDLGGVLTYHPQSLFFSILPLIEKDIVYSTGMKEPTGRTWQAILPDTGGPIYSTCFSTWFVCPADSSNSRTEARAHGWVGSSYAANAQVFGNKATEVRDPRSGEVLWNVLDSCYNIGNIPAGTSNMIFVAERFALAGPAGADTPCSWVNPPAGGPGLGNKDMDALGCPLQTFRCGINLVRASICGPGTFYGSGPNIDPVGAFEGAWKYPLPEIGVLPTEAATDGRPQSQHPAVVQVGMGDGSARGVSSAVSQLTWARAIDPMSPLWGSEW